MTTYCLYMQSNLIPFYLILEYIMRDLSQTQEVQSVRPCRSLLLIHKKKYRRIRQCHQKKGNRKLGMWNLTETIKYIAFIKQSAPKFADEQTRREERIFSLMAQQIRSRNAVQCRSHHQKMVQAYGTLQNIISHYQANVIPYYQARAKKTHMKSDSSEPTDSLESWCSVEVRKSCFRIEINQDAMGSF